MTGARGQLGVEAVRAFDAEEVVGFGRHELDICDYVYTRQRLSALRPDVVVNTAAFTLVDACEAEPERAFWANTYAVRHLAMVCADLAAVLVHISTDYVFDGSKARPYGEDDLPNPLSVYGVSKLAGEYFVRSLAPRYLIIRTSGLYGEAGAATHRGNFVETMLRLAGEGRPIRVVADQVLTPTAARDAARKLVELVRRGESGLFHVTNAGQCSWFEFAGEIFRLTGLTPDLQPVPMAAFGARARRPPYSVLARTRLAEVDADDLPSWQEALAGYLRARGRLVAPAGGAAHGGSA